MITRKNWTHEEFVTWKNDPDKHICMRTYIVDVIDAPFENVEECVFIEYSTGERGIVHQSVVAPRSQDVPFKTHGERESARYFARIEAFESVQRYSDYMDKDR